MRDNCHGTNGTNGDTRDCDKLFHHSIIRGDGDNYSGDGLLRGHLRLNVLIKLMLTFEIRVCVIGRHKMLCYATHGDNGDDDNI